MTTDTASLIFFFFLLVITICLMFDVVYSLIMMRRYEKKADALRNELLKMIENRKEYNDRD